MLRFSPLIHEKNTQLILMSQIKKLSVKELVYVQYGNNLLPLNHDDC